MAVFTEMRTLDEIKSSVKPYQRIAIITCGNCMNAIEAVKEEDHIERIIDMASGRTEYPPVQRLVTKLKDALRKEGKVVTTHVMGSDALPCQLSWDRVKPFMINKDILTSDVILAPMCACGRVGLRKMFPKHKIIRATRPHSDTYLHEVQRSYDNGIEVDRIPSIKVMPLRPTKT